jgi:hypothetical protein
VRLSEDEYQALLNRPAFKEAAAILRGPVAAKRLKYRNVPTEVDGKWFASKLEANYYKQLKNLWTLGSIAWFTRQVPFDLPGGVKYRADFLVVDIHGKLRVIDCKGKMTDTSRIKIAQVEEIYGIKIELVRKAK